MSENAAADHYGVDRSKIARIRTTDKQAVTDGRSHHTPRRSGVKPRSTTRAHAAVATSWLTFWGGVFHSVTETQAGLAALS